MTTLKIYILINKISHQWGKHITIN